MHVPVQQFLTELTRGSVVFSDKCWPQLKEILATSASDPFSVQGSMRLWKRASEWMYCNPDSPWAPETEQLFEMALKQIALSDDAEEQALLLQTWTRFGTYTPSPEHQRGVVSAMNRQPYYQDFHWMQHAFNIAFWDYPANQAKRINTAEYFAQDSLMPSPFSMYVYLHGDISLLDAVHAKEANIHLRGAMRDYPIGFDQAKMVAAFHPDPNVWTTCIMDQAWSIAKNPGPDNLWTNASQAIEHLDAMLDTMPGYGRIDGARRQLARFGHVRKATPRTSGLGAYQGHSSHY